MGQNDESHHTHISDQDTITGCRGECEYGGNS
jgi:hypothetical protein